MPTDLAFEPALSRPDLLAGPVAAALASLGLADAVQAAPIDPDLADTAAFCAAYRIGAAESANCVVVAGKRGQAVTFAACVVLATTRADVNGLVRRRLDARKVSFAAREDVARATGMEFGGITPLGLPADWPVLVDAAVAAAPWVVIGSGLRRSKLALAGKTLATLPAAEVLDGLGLPA
ncbi:YbaK/EbsC family protein [Pseudofrankia inefficax]|uniref:YbaK/prolyl-tRNA synthetase associated region n=1 Tax=Pseudofrankia inefficax (strain DSM 45817 / CECT 9037 / DDB 130130 / EuI1c) TaxID=298654 RepID=E3J2L7_PSEI1|nr:YbaK/EbsC family protein [Pseudofrankia inefficax]ADP80531.1 YbaK/prolyl-tRNA synthetase associated region [Pseudofrankia inefficax]